MKVFVDKIKNNSDYDDESKWVDYSLLMYLKAHLIRKSCKLRVCYLKKSSAIISLNRKKIKV